MSATYKVETFGNSLPTSEWETRLNDLEADGWFLHSAIPMPQERRNLTRMIFVRDDTE